MKKIYTWGIHEDYARYWTKESLADNIEFGVLWDKAKYYLGNEENCIDIANWNPPIIKEDKEDGKIIRKKGDMHSTWVGNGYLISQNMVDKIGASLKKYGLLLPLEVENSPQKLYRYYVTYEKEFSCIDIIKSKTTQSEEIESQKKLVELFGKEEQPHLDYLIDKNKSITETFFIYKVILKSECEDDVLIFRIKNVKSNTIFVTEKFIELLKKHELKGFNFKLDTSYGYYNEAILLG